MKEIHLMERVTGCSSGSHFPSFLPFYSFLPPSLPLSFIPSWLPSFPPWVPPLFPHSHPSSFSSFIICFGVIERPWGLPRWLSGKWSACSAGDAGLIPESACNARDRGLIPGLGRSPGEGKGCPLQYSGLENSMDCTVDGVANSRTQLRDFHFTSLGKIPWRREWQPILVFLPGESYGQRSLVGYTQSMGSQGNGHDWACTHIEHHYDSKAETSLLIQRMLIVTESSRPQRSITSESINSRARQTALHLNSSVVLSLGLFRVNYFTSSLRWG